MRFFLTVVIFLGLDALWLGVLAKNLYADALGSMLRTAQPGGQPLWAAAVVVYFALIVGITVFVLPKAGQDAWKALYWGALFGFVSYATYDFTNLAVLSGWSWTISLIDTAWGAFLCGVTACLVTFLARQWGA